MAREKPKSMLEGDIVFAVLGLLTVCGGSAVAARELYTEGSNNPSAPHPLLGTAIFVGLAIVLLGMAELDSVLPHA